MVWVCAGEVDAEELDVLKEARDCSQSQVSSFLVLGRSPAWKSPLQWRCLGTVRFRSFLESSYLAGAVPRSASRSGGGGASRRGVTRIGLLSSLGRKGRKRLRSWGQVRSISQCLTLQLSPIQS